jgi:hypothetical protein
MEQVDANMEWVTALDIKEDTLQNEKKDNF